MIRWNDEKDRWLKMNRGISFQEIADRLVLGKYIDVLENPVRGSQEVFVLQIEGYTWAVPFVIGENDTIFLKTAFPSRKLHRRYGGRHEEEA